MREKYESLALAELREIAKSRGMKRVTGLKKAELIELMLAEDEKDKEAGKDVEPKPILRGMKEPAFATEANKNEHKVKQTNVQGQNATKEQSTDNGERSVKQQKQYIENNNIERSAKQPEERAVKEQAENKITEEKFHRSLIVASQQEGFWKLWQMVLDLSEVIIFCQEKMMCMWRQVRSVVLGCAQEILLKEIPALRQ